MQHILLYIFKWCCSHVHSNATLHSQFVEQVEQHKPCPRHRCCAGGYSYLGSTLAEWPQRMLLIAVCSNIRHSQQAFCVHKWQKLMMYKSASAWLSDTIIHLNHHELNEPCMPHRLKTGFEVQLFKFYVLFWVGIASRVVHTTIMCPAMD